MVAKLIKPNANHVDVLSRPLQLNSPVAVCRHNRLIVCTVTRFTNKMVEVSPVKSATDWKGNPLTYKVYGADTAILEGEDAFMYILKAGF